jgi:hypothetical protein
MAILALANSGLLYYSRKKEFNVCGKTSKFVNSNKINEKI